MKLIISICLTALLSFAACLFLPWWSIAIAAFLVAMAIPNRPAFSFLTGFVAVFLLWSLLAFTISNNNNDLLAHKVSLLILKMDSPGILILATGLIGGLVAGLAALTASFTRKPAE